MTRAYEKDTSVQLYYRLRGSIEPTLCNAISSRNTLYAKFDSYALQLGELIP